MTIYKLDGSDLAAFLNDIKTRESSGDWNQRITALFIEPRRDNLVLRFNTDDWYRPIGHVVSDAMPGDEWERQNKAGLRAIVKASSIEDPANHDYEPGEGTHPMHTDPMCRICGQARNLHRGER